MKRFRAAIIGGGFIGQVHIENLRRLGNVDVVGLCEKYNAQEKADALGIEKGFSDYKEMIQSLKPDSVHICTPNNTHYEIAAYAIENGVHFICEKPFTTTVEQAEELVRLACQNNVYGAVNFHNRLYPIPNEMSKMVKDGEIGKIFSIHGAYLQDWLLYDTDYTWRLDKSQVGKTRAIADIGSHWIDLAEFVSGEKITEVNALFKTVHPIRKRPLVNIKTFASAKGNVPYEEIHIDTEDEAGGAIGTSIISMVFSGKKNTTELSISGSKKSICWSSENINDLFIGNRSCPNQILTKDTSLMHKQASVFASYPGGHAEGFSEAFKNVFTEFYTSIENPGTYEYATLKDGLHQMQLSEAIYKSAISGEWVSVE